MYRNKQILIAFKQSVGKLWPRVLFKYSGLVYIRRTLLVIHVFTNFKAVKAAFFCGCPICLHLRPLIKQLCLNMFY